MVPTKGKIIKLTNVRSRCISQVSFKKVWSQNINILFNINFFAEFRKLRKLLKTLMKDTRLKTIHIGKRN